jgi:16S rRNA (uracil1498-N3)-methyltransferase
MHRHYLEPARFSRETLVLEREEARHLQSVLRVRDGEVVELFDGCGQTVRVRVSSTGRHTLQLTREAPPTCHAPPACRLVLFACISKGKRMDWTIEKGVELGVSRIIPVLSERTIVRLDEEGAEGRADRWQRVAVEAARQCGTPWLPAVDPPRPFAAIPPLVAACAPVLVAALTPAARPLRQVLAALRTPRPPPVTIGWFVGPEGDFTPQELDRLQEAGALPVSCGPQILRTETAALWGLCVLGAEFL